MIGENFGMIDFKNRGINIDSTFRCTLECPSCMRQSYKTRNLKVPGDDMPWSDFIKITKFFKSVQFCGQISDPIFNPNLIKMLKHTHDNNINTIVNTAASQKSKEWYTNAFKANKNAIWIFGLDGLPKDSHKYRIHQNGQHLFEMMKLAKKLGNIVSWQYIVFSYNEKDVETARTLAKKYDMHFRLTFSGRWDNLINKYKPKNPKYYLNSKRTVND